MRLEKVFLPVAGEPFPLVSPAPAPKSLQFDRGFTRLYVFFFLFFRRSDSESSVAVFKNHFRNNKGPIFFERAFFFS